MCVARVVEGKAFEAGAAHAVAQIKAREVTDAEIDALAKEIQLAIWEKGGIAAASRWGDDGIWAVLTQVNRLLDAIALANKKGNSNDN